MNFLETKTFFCSFQWLKKKSFPSLDITVTRVTLWAAITEIIIVIVKLLYFWKY